MRPVRSPSTWTRSSSVFGSVTTATLTPMRQAAFETAAAAFDTLLLLSLSSIVACGLAAGTRVTWPMCQLRQVEHKCGQSRVQALSNKVGLAFLLGCKK